MGQVISLIWLMMATMMRATTDSHRNTITPATRRREKPVAVKGEKRADMSPKSPNATDRTKRNGARKPSRIGREVVATVLPMMNLN